MIARVLKESEYDTVILITGSRICNTQSAALDYFNTYNHNVITIGNCTHGFSFDEISDTLSKKENLGKTLLYIEAHGAIASYSNYTVIIHENEEDDDNESDEIKSDYTLLADSETEFYAQDVFSEIFDIVGHKIDLIADTCHSGALFNEEHKEYFNRIFATASMHAVSNSINTEVTINALQKTDQGFSFENFVTYFLNNSITNTESIVWNDSGFKFDASSSNKDKTNEFIQYQHLLTNEQGYLDEDILMKLMSPYCQNPQLISEADDENNQDQGTLEGLVKSYESIQSLCKTFFISKALQCNNEIDLSHKNDELVTAYENALSLHEQQLVGHLYEGPQGEF